MSDEIHSSTEVQQDDTEPTEDQDVFGDTDFLGGESLRWRSAQYLISTLEFCSKRIRNRKLSGTERARWARVGVDSCKVLLFSSLTKGGIAKRELNDISVTGNDDDSKALVLMDKILKDRMKQRDPSSRRVDYNTSR